MSRQSSNIPIELDKGVKIKIGGNEVILTCNPVDDPDKLPVSEIYVSKTTGKLVIVYDDKE